METTGIDLEDKYTYVPPFPKLEDLAILTVSLDLWNYYYSHYHTDSCDEDDELDEVNELINDMKMPNCIKEKIIKLCETIDDQLDSYHYHDPDIVKLCNAYKNRKHFFLYGPVWNTNGHINGKKTAEKVLQYRERLNDNDAMFRVIAKYCLEKYMNNFSLRLLTENWNRGNYGHEMITLYWWRKLHTEKKTASGSRSTGWDRLFQYEKRKLLEALKQAEIKGWHEYEYFWDFLDENDHLSMAKKLIQSSEHVQYQMILFSKLSRHQLVCLFLEEPVAIIANFFQLNEFELAKAAWDRVKSTIQGEEFQDLIERILYWEMLSENNDIQCLVDIIWNSAPVNLIDYVINVNDCEITEIFFSQKPKYVSSSSFNFLKVIFPRTTLEFRKQFFLQKGLYLILNYTQVVLSSLIEHCLDVCDQVEIKETILATAMESEPRKILGRFRNILFYRSLEEFYKLLTFLTSQHDLQTRVKKRLLRSGLLNIRGLTRVDDWAKVSQFIDELYPNEEEARRHKRKMVFSYLDSHCSYWGCFRRNGEDKFTEIDHLINQYLTQEEIVKYKENTANKFREVCSCPRWLSSQHIKRVNIPKLISWCYSGNEEKMSQYRRSFPIDTAFRLLLRDIVERVINYRDGHVSFSSLEELLRWKFSSKKKKIKTFKRSQLYNIMRIPYVSAHIRCTKPSEFSTILKEMIPWFFDDDESKIEEFQQLIKEDTMQIIHWLRLKEECWVCHVYCYRSDDESD
ncbi:uncharacterized protein LOC135846827 isoform X1 [Planococcus citri]|uniref:uncharacterized protein LOC135846827 isoform X1 n=1 Tax=Planococcus citri TaxID=170843 RepID=UPI0031F8843D